MRLLLDTHVLLAMLRGQNDIFGRVVQRQIEGPDCDFHVSVASLWEIAIKSRLSKLHLPAALETLPELIADLDMSLLSINEHHALALIEPEPDTKDPFDRILLAQCQVEDLRLLTADRALVGHRLAAEQV